MASFSLDAVEAIMRQNEAATADAAELDAIEAMLRRWKQGGSAAAAKVLLVDSPMGGEPEVLAQLGPVRTLVDGPCLVVRASNPPDPLPPGALAIRRRERTVPDLATHRRELEETCQELGVPGADAWLDQLQGAKGPAAAVEAAMAGDLGEGLPPLLAEWLGVSQDRAALIKAVKALALARPAWAAEVLALSAAVAACEDEQERSEVWDSLGSVPSAART